VAILYPNQIANVYVRETEFIGNIVSVGNDGLYPYDYINPSSAFAAAPTNSLILIYPGTYTMTTDNDINKNFFIRGMGDTTTSVIIQNEPSKYETIITKGYSSMTYLIFENFQCRTNHSNAAAFVIWRGVGNTDVYFNKMDIYGAGGGAFCIDFYNSSYPGKEYKGDCYITYVRCRPAASFMYRGLGFGNPVATYSFTGIEYNKVYSCQNCSYAPNPHAYSVGASPSTGYNYGDYLIRFNVPPPAVLPPDEAIYRNVWVVGENIYHTTTSGIDVYNEDASSLIAKIHLPSSNSEYYSRVDFDTPTLYDDCTVTVTLSGSSHIYSYSTTGNDIHFQDDIENELGFWVETWNHLGSSEIFLNIPSSGTDHAYIFYGNDAGVDYARGSGEDAFLFYDDFSTIHSTNTGMSTDWTIPAEDEAQFVVDAGGLRVSGQELGPGVYANAFVDIDKGYNFYNPMVVQTSIGNVYAPGSAGEGYNQFHVWFTGGSQGSDAWGWYREATYNQRVNHGNDSDVWAYGSNIGMDGEDAIITVYFTGDYTRAVVERNTNPFDITYSGSNRTPEVSQLQMFSAHDFAYNVDYVKIHKPLDYIGTVASGITTISHETSTVPTSVWANMDDIYISTLEAGVLTVPTSISGNAVAAPYKQTPYITSNNTTYLHGAGDYLCVTTQAGVDRYNLDTDDRIFTYQTNAHKCFQTTSGTLYYAENNIFLGLDEDPLDLGGAIREWEYYQILRFVPTIEDNYQIIVIFQLDFPYQNVKAAGEDIRFLDRHGNNLKYYIEDWYPSARILVKIPVAGTDHVYMLYGNSAAAAQTSVDAYYFHDDFTTLDTSVWATYKGHGNNYVSSNGSYITMYDYNNSGTAMVTKAKVPYSMLIETRMRRSGPTTITQFDGVHGYSSVHTKNRPNRGYVIIDPTTGSDERLHYLHAYDTSIQGTASFSTTWYVWSAVWSKGYQMSEYRDEVLERTSTNAIYDADGQYFMYHIDNSSSNPNLNLDWMRMQSYPYNITYTNDQLLLWDLIHPRLNAVYRPTSNWITPDHIYEEFFGIPLIIRDLYITEGTSSYNNNNTIFLATDRGAHVIEERQGDEENANLKRYYID